jgi:hypothetical protein
VRVATRRLWPTALFLLFALFVAITFVGRRMLSSLLLAWLQMKGVKFHFFNSVLLLHLAFKAAKSIFKRRAFLQTNLWKFNYTPRLVLNEPVIYCNLAA